MEPPIQAERADKLSGYFGEEREEDDPTVASMAPRPPMPEPPLLPASFVGDRETLSLPNEILVHPGSFTVSTMAVTTALFMLLFVFLAFLAAGLLTGLGMGLALVGLLL